MTENAKPEDAANGPQKARMGTAATLPPRANGLAHAPTMLGLDAGGANNSESIGRDPTLLGVDVETAQNAGGLGHAPTLMGIEAEPAPKPAAPSGIGHDPTLMGIEAKPATPPGIGHDPTLMGVSSPSATSVPWVTPTTHAPEPPGTSRTRLWLGLGVAGMLTLGGLAWAAGGSKKSEPAPTKAETPVEAAPATAPEAKKPTERRSSATTKNEEKKRGGGRGGPRPIRRLGRRLGIP